METSNKILSICLPTYNRSACIKQQLERMSTFPASYLEIIEIIISDNCSQDDTQKIVESFKNKFDFSYYRNNENKGMDYNFHNCITKAKGKYVWLLGDDDIIDVGNFSLLLDELLSGDYGLLHVKCSSSKFKSEEYIDIECFLKEIGIYISFLSSNIFQKIYLDKINLTNYFGTYFLQIPAYLFSALYAKKNKIVYFKLFEQGIKSSENGGYNIFEVFVKNYLDIFRNFLDSNLISQSLYKKEIIISKRFIIPYFYNFFIRKESCNFKTDNGLHIMYNYFGKWETWSSVVKFILKNIIYKINNKLNFFIISNKNI